MVEHNITDKTLKSYSDLNGDEQAILYNPDASTDADRCITMTLSELAKYLTTNGLVGSPSLNALLLSSSSLDAEASQATTIGTLSNNNPNSTLAAFPTGVVQLSGTSVQKGASDFSIAGTQYISVTETLSGSPNSPLTTDFPITVTRDADPEIGDVWAIDKFANKMINCFFQEDVSSGKVSTWTARGAGAKNGSQGSESLQPTKLTSGEGVLFAENSGQTLAVAGEADASPSYRWAITNFKVDGSTGSGDNTLIWGVNNGSTAAGYPHCRITYNKTNGLTVTWRGRSSTGDTVSHYFYSTDIVDDG